MKRISCTYNMDTACVEIRYDIGAIIAIDCIAIENQYARNRSEQSELDYLIFNDPAAYAELVLYGSPEAYLRAVTEYHPMDW